MGRTGTTGDNIKDGTIEGKDLLNDTITINKIDTTSVNSHTLPFDDSSVSFVANTMQEAVEQAVSLGGDAQYFDAYDSMGGSIIGNTWTPISLTQERKKSASFIHDNVVNSSEVIINEDTTVMIFASGKCDLVSGTALSQARMKVSIFTTSWIDVTGSIRPFNVTESNDYATSIMVISMLQGQKLRLEMINDGPNIINSAIGSNLAIVKFKGEKGDKGSVGNDGQDGNNGNDGLDGLNSAVEQLVKAVKFIGGDGSIAIVNDGLDGETPTLTEVSNGVIVSVDGNSALVKHGEPTPKKLFFFSSTTNIFCEHNFAGLVTVDVFTTTFSEGQLRLAGSFLSGSLTTGTSIENSGYDKLNDNQYTVDNILNNSIEINLSTLASGVIIVRN